MIISRQSLQDLFKQQYGYINNFDIHNFIPQLIGVDKDQIKEIKCYSDSYSITLN